MKATYNIEYPIDILFDQMDPGQDSAIAEILIFSDQKLADMGISKIIATQEYTYMEDNHSQ